MLGAKLVPGPLCAPKIAYGLNWDGARFATETDRKLYNTKNGKHDT
jgi:hypothetical protein